MHHTNRLPQFAFGSMLLSLALGIAAPAQEPPPPPKDGQPAVGVKALVVPIGVTQRLQMSKKQRISNARNPKPTIANVQSDPKDPSSVLVTGLDAGITRITLIDENKVEENVDVIVQFDIEYLRTLLRQAVPTANIQLLPTANGTVILTGNVARAEDIAVIEATAASVVGDRTKVINGMRMGGVMQVQLDVVVARVSRDELRRMAFDFMNFGSQHVLASTVGGGFVVPSAMGGTSGGGGIGGSFPGRSVTIPNSIGNPNGVPSNLFLAIFTPQQDFFGLLQALRDESVAKIIAKPTLVTLSGRPGSFLDGGEQAIPVPAGLGQVGVQFEEFGTRLNFLPIVLGNGKIHLEVEPEVSELNAAFGTSISGTVVPGRTTQRIHTTVELEDGQTYVLGGLIQHNTTGTTTKTPILGDLPFVGAFFSKKSFDDLESELVVLVTPHLIDAMSCDQVGKILPGEETRSPDDFELFLEGILEAPRGSRVVCPDHKYLPAWKNGPTAGLYPCGGGDGRCGGHGCSGDGRCGGCGCRAGEASEGCSAISGLLPSGAREAKPLPVENAMPRAGLNWPPTATPATSPSAGLAPGSNSSKPVPLPPLLVNPGGTDGQP